MPECHILGVIMLGVPSPQAKAQKRGRRRTLLLDRPKRKRRSAALPLRFLCAKIEKVAFSSRRGVTKDNTQRFFFVPFLHFEESVPSPPSSSFVYVLLLPCERYYSMTPNTKYGVTCIIFLGIFKTMELT